jgi:HAD superfamily hydrolase (TIGR01549 family)
MIKAVIFDVDGVLLDDVNLYVKAFQSTARELGREVPSESRIKMLLGMTRKEVLTKLFGEIDERMEDIHEKNVKSFEKGITMTKGIKTFLTKLTLRKAIVTSKNMDIVEKQLESIAGFFEIIITCDQTKKHKPDPEPLLLACEKLGVNPKEALYVGDAINDWKAAKNAGTGFIGFTGGAATAEEFEYLKARHVDSLKDLLVELE